MRTLHPYLLTLDAMFLAALGGVVACGNGGTGDAGADATESDVALDGPFIFESGGGCFDASTAITYELCADASDAGADDACAASCGVACERLFAVTTCSENGADAGVAYANCFHELCKGGRRPTGLAKPRDAAGFAGWLAGVAWMEAASVHAFERLARELDAHGAPRWLRREARRAARDEMRHARTMARLASSRGARVPSAHLRTKRVRSLAAIARENAVEGCVHETFSALAAQVQAERSTDPSLRRAMQTIAPDEKRHAALALAVAAWIEPRLSSSERSRVRHAKGRAETNLIESLGRSPAIPNVGFPAGVRARELARRLFVGVDRGKM